MLRTFVFGLRQLLFSCIRKISFPLRRGGWVERGQTRYAPAPPPQYVFLFDSCGAAMGCSLASPALLKRRPARRTFEIQKSFGRREEFYNFPIPDVGMHEQRDLVKVRQSVDFEGSGHLARG